MTYTLDPITKTATTYHNDPTTEVPEKYFCIARAAEKAHKTYGYSHADLVYYNEARNQVGNIICQECSQGTLSFEDLDEDRQESLLEFYEIYLTKAGYQ